MEEEIDTAWPSPHVGVAAAAIATHAIVSGMTLNALQVVSHCPVWPRCDVITVTTKEDRSRTVGDLPQDA